MAVGLPSLTLSRAVGIAQLTLSMAVGEAHNALTITKAKRRLEAQHEVVLSVNVPEAHRVVPRGHGHHA